MKLKNSHFTGILLLVCIILFIQPVYAAPPFPNGEMFISYDFPPLQENKEQSIYTPISLAVTSTVTSTLEGQEELPYKVYLPTVFANDPEITKIQKAVRLTLTASSHLIVELFDVS